MFRRFYFPPRRATMSLDNRLAAMRSEVVNLWPQLLSDIRRPAVNQAAQKVLSAIENLHIVLTEPAPDGDDTQPIPVFDGERDS